MKHVRIPVLMLLAGLGASPALLAQYKVVEPDGRITYTDRPATASSTAKVAPIRSADTGPGVAALPYELRQVAQRYPVTLYTRGDCPSCDSGRAMLRQRGIPFAEKTVVTQADIAAFRQVESGDELPVLRIGAQQLRGYSEQEWSGYLDAAAYPKQSRLPAGYRGWEPQPLVPPTATAAAAAAAAPVAPPAADPPTLPPTLQGTPDGIRF